MNRTRFKKDILPEFNSAGTENRFVNELRETLYRNRRPIYFSERFDHSIETCLELNKDTHKQIRNYRAGLLMIASGEVEAGLIFAYESLKKRTSLVDKADKNIAENLNTAEDIIRERYGLSQNIIDLDIQIGAAHSPELHLDYNNSEVEVSIDDISGDEEHKKLNIVLTDLIREGQSQEYVCDFLLKHAKMFAGKNPQLVSKGIKIHQQK